MLNMSSTSFKSYGKIHEADQAKLDDSRKTRRRLIIIAVSSLVLVSVIVAAVVGSTQSNKSSKHGDDKSQSLSSSVKLACDQTLYKETCYMSLGPKLNQQAKPQDIFIMALQVASAELTKASDYFSDSDNGAFHFNSSTDKMAILALSDCRELLSLALDHLADALASGDLEAILASGDELMTWISTARTCQQTCIDGFEEVRQELKVAAEKYLKSSGEMTSNSLAILSWICRVADSFKLNQRRLLSSTSTSTSTDGETPEWASRQGRVLLVQAADLRKKANVVVAKDGSGKYKTIAAALKAVPEKSKKRFVIYVKKGVYFENVRIEKPMWNVTFVGDGMEATIVSGSLNVVDGTPTFSTASFAVFGKGFMAREMGFRNTAGAAKHQAVALMSSADMSVFYRCRIDGFQDSLYAHANRQFYRECNIYGTVDFIFGNSAVVIQNCNILPRVPMLGQQNTITAQGKVDPNQNTGISIQNCTIWPYGNLSNVKTYLGRPWKNYSTTVYMHSMMGGLINPSGWLPWVGDSAPSTIYYAEYQNFGPGSSTKNRVKWKGLRTITSKDATKFTVKAFLQGDKWIPGTGVNYKPGL